MQNARAASLVLLAAGIVLVFAGLASALTFSPIGMIASAALVAALLYAGGVWLGPRVQPGDPQVVLFTRELAVASGASLGRPVGELFPHAIRAAIEAACREAIEGRAARFTPTPGRSFAVSPVRSPEGAVVYGVLLTGQAAAAGASRVMPAF